MNYLIIVFVFAGANIIRADEMQATPLKWGSMTNNLQVAVSANSSKFKVGQYPILSVKVRNMNTNEYYWGSYEAYDVPEDPCGYGVYLRVISPGGKEIWPQKTSGSSIGRNSYHSSMIVNNNSTNDFQIDVNALKLSGDFPKLEEKGIYTFFVCENLLPQSRRVKTTVTSNPIYLQIISE